jgi:hypothetical protein
MLVPTPAQDLSEYLDSWAAARLSCKPADRTTAEDGVRLAYIAAGLQPPQRIIWCSSPFDMAERLAGVDRNDDTGANVKGEVFTSARDRVGTFAEIFWKEVVSAAAETHARFGARHAGRGLLGAPRVLPRSSFDEVAVSCGAGCGGSAA